MYKSRIEELLIDKANLDYKVVILSDPAFSSFVFNDFNEKNYECELLNSGVVLHFKENLFEATKILETYLKNIIAKFRKKENVNKVDFKVNFFDVNQELSKDEKDYVHFVYDFESA